LSLVSPRWSAAPITKFSFSLAGPEKFGLVFNDMASRVAEAIQPPFCPYAPLAGFDPLVTWGDPRSRRA